jgi:gas vesicle protein
MDNLKNTGKMVGSIAIGALAGVTLGVLFAPRKGTKTRNKIAGGAEKISKNLKKKMSKEAKNFKKSIKKEAKIIKNKASEIEGLVEDKMESASANLKEKAIALLHMTTDHQLTKK